MKPVSRRAKRLLVAAGLVIGVPVVGHGIVGVSTRIEPPAIAAPSGEPTEAGDLRTLGPAYARHRGKILEVRLSGTPEQMGWQHGRLLHREMVANEGVLYHQFETFVPFAPARWLMMDVSRVQFRAVDRGMSADRRREVAAQALAFAPDPYESVLPTYHRFVFLQSLYDISLSFEHSPLLGCTSFTLSGSASEGGHAILARNFDFEAGPVFDEGKAVFVVREEGKIPYASVAWPGLVGVVTGMNAEGVALVVHGGRAREPDNEGEPVVQTMREVLATAKTTGDAVALLGQKRPMVSHIVMVLDASGDTAIAERAPGAPLFVRPRGGRTKVPLTNHFEGPLALDTANQSVETLTSTRPRRTRLDELLENLPEGASVQRVMGVLRDKKGPSGLALPLGNRKAIDALIATHGVVMDATARVLWVSEGPHLAGRFLRFDLARLADPGYDPKLDEAFPAGAPAPQGESLPEDEILTDGTYDAWVRRGSLHSGDDAVMDRRTFVLSALAGVALTALPIEALAQDELSKALADVTKARASLKNLVASFTQVRTIGLLATEVKSEGEMTLVRPDRLRWELKGKDAITYWIGPEGFAFATPSGSTSVGKGGAGRFDLVLKDLMTLLGGDLEDLRARYDLSIPSRDGGIVLLAKPKTDDVKKHVKSLEMAAGPELWSVKRVVLEEKNGDKSVITFSAVARDVNVDPAKMKPPAK